MFPDPPRRQRRTVPLTRVQFQNLFAINLPYRYDHRDSLSLAAAFSGLQIEYVDGVTNVSRDYLPPGGKEKNLKDGVLGAWRAHMNVLRM